MNLLDRYIRTIVDESWNQLLGKGTLPVANMTLGDDLTAVLSARNAVQGDNLAIKAANNKLTSDQSSQTTAENTLATDLVASGVPAVVAPSLNDDGTLSVAVATPGVGPGFAIYDAAPANTAIPGAAQSQAHAS